MALLTSPQLPLNCGGRWCKTSFLHFSLFSTESRPVYSLMLSSCLFFCLPRLLPPFTVLCKMVLARPDERETWPYHCSSRLFSMVKRSSCGPIACWILARTSSLVTWSLCEMRIILLWSSAVRVHDSQACTWHLLACRVRVTVGDLVPCCCVPCLRELLILLVCWFYPSALGLILFKESRQFISQTGRQTGKQRRAIRQAGRRTGK